MPDIVIVGGGIIGCATAYYLKQRGLRATIIEQRRVAAHSSGKAGGFLAKHWCRGSHVDELAKMSFELHEGLMVTARAEGRELGYRYLNATTEGGDEIGAVGACAQVDPKALTEYFAEAAEDIIIGEVTGVVEDGDKDSKEGGDGAANDAPARGITGIVLTDGRVIPCQRVVFCVGSWSADLREWLREPSLPSSHAHDGGHVHVVVKDCAMPATAVFSDACEVYPRPGNEVYICGDKPDPVTGIPQDPDALRPTEDEAAALLASAAAVCPELRNARVHSSGLCCLPTYATKAFGPTISPVPRRRNAYFACGHSCWGILHAPGTGKVLAELVAEGGQCSWEPYPKFAL